MTSKKARQNLNKEGVGIFGIREREGGKRKFGRGGFGVNRFNMVSLVGGCVDDQVSRKSVKTGIRNGDV
jgi:hypothetical protein